MGSEVLKIFLPAFIVVFVLITFFWKWFRRLIRLEVYRKLEQTVSYKRVKRINGVFLVLFFLYVIMTFVYSLLPEMYYVFVPFESFDHPLINSAGVLLLKAALIWMIVAQLHIDKELYKYSRKSGDLTLMELVYFSERMFLGGLTVMFVGMFVTITNLIGILAGLISLYFYYNYILKDKVLN